MYYTYIHYRADNKEPFYIGEGSGSRYITSAGRTPQWQTAVDCHGYIPEILAHWNTKEEARSHEELLIECFKDLGYSLVNQKSKWNEAWNRGKTLTEDQKKNMRGPRGSNPKISESRKNERRVTYISTNAVTGQTTRIGGVPEIIADGWSRSKVQKAVKTGKLYRGHYWTKEKIDTRNSNNASIGHTSQNSNSVCGLVTIIIQGELNCQQF